MSHELDLFIKITSFGGFYFAKESDVCWMTTSNT